MQMINCEKIYLSDGSILEDRDCAIHDSGFLIVDGQDIAFNPVWYSIGQSVARLEGVTIRKRSQSSIDGCGRIG